MLIRICIRALAFGFLLPMIPGISFHGGVIVAIGMAILFSIMQYVVEIAAVAVSAWMTITTLGMALLILIPMWILGFWLLPVVTLKWVSDLMPQYLAVGGWKAALFGGLVLLVVGMVTGDTKKIRNREVS